MVKLDDEAMSVRATAHVHVDYLGVYACVHMCVCVCEDVQVCLRMCGCVKEENNVYVCIYVYLFDWDTTNPKCIVYRVLAQSARFHHLAIEDFKNI